MKYPLRFCQQCNLLVRMKLMRITNLFKHKLALEISGQLVKSAEYLFNLIKQNLLPRKSRISLRVDLLSPVRNWLDNFEIKDSVTAHRICQLIPSQCPFARDIVLFNRKVLTVPPLCKLNPLYQNLISLKFRSLVYLADQCGEDVSAYC